MGRKTSTKKGLYKELRGHSQMPLLRACMIKPFFLYEHERLELQES
jgi:hypothetical protein